MFPFPDFFGGGQTFCNEIQYKTKDVMMRMEGKEYVVQDGDVILFRFNV